MSTRTILVGTTLVIAAPAMAQDAPGVQLQLPSRDAAPPMEQGAFVPFTTSPSANGARVQTFVSLDAARDTARLDAMGQIPIIDRLQLRVDLDYDEGDTDPAIAAQVDVLRERTAPIDLQLTGGWDNEGVNDASAVFGEATVGRSLRGDFYAFGGARFDFGVGGEEAGMRLTAATVRPLGYGLVAGLDSRLDVDLTQDDNEIATESTWALHVGPVIGYTNDLVAVTASVGLATNQARNDDDTSVGAFAGAGFGIAL